MDIDFQDSELERLAFDESYIGALSPSPLKAYRKQLNLIRQSPNRQVLYAFRSLRLEKLKGKLKDKYSMRINDQFRLIVRFAKKNGKDIIVILKIEDYH